MTVSQVIAVVGLLPLLVLNFLILRWGAMLSIKRTAITFVALKVPNLLLAWLMIHFAFEKFKCAGNGMAPTLLGYHRMYHCPNCGHLAFGYVKVTEQQRPGSNDTFLGFLRRFAAGPRTPDEPLHENPLILRQRVSINALCYCSECWRMGLVFDDPTAHLQPLDKYVVNKFLAARRWDVVSFIYRHQSGRQHNEVRIARVIGLPGEELKIQNGQVLIDGKAQRPPSGIEKLWFDAEFLIDSQALSKGVGNEPATPDGARAPDSIIGKIPDAFKGIESVLVRRAGRGSPEKLIKLGMDEYFLVGDSMVTSDDSRADSYPQVRKSDIKGVGVFRYSPFWRFDRLRPAQP